MRLDVTRGLKEMERGFEALQRRQIPFASALGLTTLAKGLQADETAEIPKAFNSPTPFTQKAYGMTSATKTRPIASVFAKDIQAQYLAPFVFGGLHFLGAKKGMLAPRNVRLNQYGNIPRGKLQALAGRPDVFVGAVTFKRTGQTVRGVWQRPPVGQRMRYANATDRLKRGGGLAAGRGTKGNTQTRVGGTRTGLKLLIRFEDPLPVTEHLDFFERAARYIQDHAEAAFQEAFATAFATARP